MLAREAGHFPNHAFGETMRAVPAKSGALVGDYRGLKKRFLGDRGHENYISVPVLRAMRPIAIRNTAVQAKPPPGRTRRLDVDPRAREEIEKAKGR